MPDIGSLWPFETDDTFFDRRVIVQMYISTEGFIFVIRLCDFVCYSCM
jgi:hypothetical protein